MTTIEATRPRPGFFFSGVVAAIALTIACLSSRHLESAAFERARLLPPPDLRHFSFGFGESVADLFWIRVLQDFDACETAKVEGLCRGRSWVFRMLDLITDLAPQFRRPYATGGLALSILVGDAAGASRMFDKAVEAFPRDWPILTRAAYQALYEEKNEIKAAKLMERAARLGAPNWYYSLAARLYRKSGQEEARQRLLEALRQDPSLPAEVLERIDETLSRGGN